MTCGIRNRKREAAIVLLSGAFRVSIGPLIESFIGAPIEDLVESSYRNARRKPQLKLRRQCRRKPRSKRFRATQVNGAGSFLLVARNEERLRRNAPNPLQGKDERPSGGAQSTPPGLARILRQRVKRLPPSLAGGYLGPQGSYSSMRPNFASSSLAAVHEGQLQYFAPASLRLSCSASIAAATSSPMSCLAGPSANAITPSIVVGRPSSTSSSLSVAAATASSLASAATAAPPCGCCVFGDLRACIVGREHFGTLGHVIEQFLFHGIAPFFSRHYALHDSTCMLAPRRGVAHSAMEIVAPLIRIPI